MNLAHSIKVRYVLYKYKFLRACGHKKYTHFIILTRPRTGSNLLVSFLDSHPNIDAKAEIFRWLKGKDYKKMLADAFDKQPYYIKAKGFKIFYFHPNDDDNCKVWDDLVEMKNLHVIHLKRRNLLRALVSEKIAQDSRVWSTTKKDQLERVHSKKVAFTVDELSRGFEQTENWETEAEKMFSDHRMISVYYEDLVGNTETWFRKILDFLGVQYIDPETTLLRQNPEGLADLIENYTELRDAFMDTKWGHCFTENKDGSV